MQIAVKPESRPQPARRPYHLVPGRHDPCAVDPVAELLHTLENRSRPLYQGHATPGIVGCTRRGRLMQCAQELTQVHCIRGWVGPTAWTRSSFAGHASTSAG